MAEPSVTPSDLDRQIDEMMGGPEVVAGVPQPPGPEAPPSIITPPVPDREPTIEVAAPPPAAPAGEDRLAAALATIENLSREVQQLKTSYTPAPVARVEAARPEPSIEFEEVLGRRVPKSRDQRPIRVDANDLLRLGWNEDPAKVIELLGNALFDFLIDVIPNHTTQTWQARTQAEQTQASRINAFWSAHEDLRDLAPFVKTVEDMSLADGSLNPRSFGNDQTAYGMALGRKVREKVAAMRGMSYDQYVTSVASGASAAAPSTSRAVSTGGGSPRAGGGRPAPGRGTQQAEIDDLIDNR